MKFPVFLCSAATVFAGEKNVQMTEPVTTLPWSLKMDAAWVGKGDLDRGGDVSVFESRVQLALQKPLGLPTFGGEDPHWVLRAGVEWERYGFNLSDATPHYLPGTLQSLSGIVGLEYRTKVGLGAILEARPGFFYEHDISGRNFDVPLQGAIVIPLGDRAALVAGTTYSSFRKNAVRPFPGIYWKISDKWVLNAIPPNPRVEYIVSDAFRWWLGAELAGGSYRTDADRSGKLNLAVITYDDYRGGAGVQWKFAPDWSFEAGAGVSWHRKFDFQRAEVGVETNDIAPFVKLSLRGEW